jgi:hypothetical protein
MIESYAIVGVKLPKEAPYLIKELANAEEESCGCVLRDRKEIYFAWGTSCSSLYVGYIAHHREGFVNLDADIVQSVKTVLKEWLEPQKMWKEDAFGLYSVIVRNG